MCAVVEDDGYSFEANDDEELHVGELAATLATARDGVVVATDGGARQLGEYQGWRAAAWAVVVEGQAFSGLVQGVEQTTTCRLSKAAGVVRCTTGATRSSGPSGVWFERLCPFSVWLGCPRTAKKTTGGRLTTGRARPFADSAIRRRTRRRLVNFGGWTTGGSSCATRWRMRRPGLGRH